MKATASRRTLAEAARWVARAIGRNVQMPVMNGMLIDAGPDGVWLAAWDGTLALSALVGADVAEFGIRLVPGRAFTDYLANARGDTVELEDVDHATIRVKAGRSTSTLRLLPINDYPPLQDVDADGGISVPADMLRQALGAVVRHTGEPTLAWQAGVHLEAVGGRLSFTCGTRYSIGQTSIPSAGELDLLLPADPLADLLAGLDGDVTISYAGEGAARFDDGARWGQLASYAEAYPKITMIFDQQRPAEVGMVTADLAAAARLAGTSADRVQLDIADNEITVRSYAPERSDGGEIVDVIEATGGEPNVIILATTYLGAILAGCGDELVLHYDPAKAKPVMFTSGDARHAVARIRPGEAS